MLTKNDLVNAIAAEVGISKAQADRALVQFSTSIKAELVRGGEAVLPDLGRLKTAKRAAREGRNPRTGEAIKIAARTVPVFSASQGLKDAVDKPAPKARKK